VQSLCQDQALKCPIDIDRNAEKTACAFIEENCPALDHAEMQSRPEAKIHRQHSTQKGTSAKINLTDVPRHPVSRR
jgi:hypothetical protein